MGLPLRALLVEDDEQDALLLLRELKRGGFDVTHQRVDTPEALKQALEQPWDIVFSDYFMPRFSAPMALKLVKQCNTELPFIIVSGTVSEEMAVNSIHAGASDFMAKGKLTRLIPAVDRELRDVTFRAERKKMHDQLLISDRMASMGMLAAGVAHEINNPLASAMANLDLVMLEVAERADTPEKAAGLAAVSDGLKDAREALERIRVIVRDLKIFSGSKDEHTGPVDVQRVMDSTLRMARNEIRHRAKLVKNYSETPPVEASESRLGQVFLNLVVNAAQAIAEGRTENNEIRISTGVNSHGKVVIEVADTGPGMSPEVLKQLFTPFFTTKPIGVGTGLGLSICHRIITGLGGTLDVQSELGQGTTFRIVLDAARTAPVDEPVPQAPALTARRRGRILVVDDEPMIIKVVQRALSQEHEVIAFNNAQAALDKIVAGERFDLIFCDLMMPQLTGMDLYTELVKVAPEQAANIIFLTGGAFTPKTRAFLEEAPNGRLEKPFDAQHLRGLVNQRIR